MPCSRCGTALPEGARFCPNCAAPVGEHAPEGLPPWARATGLLSALVVLVLLVVTQVVPSQAEEVAAAVVAGGWDCDLDYTRSGVTTDWDVEFFEDGRVLIESQSGEESEGEWTFEEGRLHVDFGDADLGNPELETESVDVGSSLDEIVMRFERTADDDEEDVGDRTLTCERDVD